MSKVERKKQQVIEKVAQHLVVNGLTDVGLRTLAAVSDTSDRMLIYYFGTKDALLGEAMQVLAATLAQQLDAALGEHRRPAATLLQEVAALSGSPDFMPVIQLWFEIVGLAVRGQSPYAENAAAVAANWHAWVASRIEEEEQATAVFAQIEGRLMVSLIGMKLE